MKRIIKRLGAIILGLGVLLAPGALLGIEQKQRHEGNFHKPIKGRKAQKETVGKIAEYKSKSSLNINEPIIQPYYREQGFGYPTIDVKKKGTKEDRRKSFTRIKKDTPSNVKKGATEDEKKYIRALITLNPSTIDVLQYTKNQMHDHGGAARL